MLKKKSVAYLRSWHRQKNCFIANVFSATTYFRSLFWFYHIKNRNTAEIRQPQPMRTKKKQRDLFLCPPFVHKKSPIRTTVAGLPNSKFITLIKLVLEAIISETHINRLLIMYYGRDMVDLNKLIHFNNISVYLYLYYKYLVLCAFSCMHTYLNIIRLSALHTPHPISPFDSGSQCIWNAHLIHHIGI